MKLIINRGRQGFRCARLGWVAAAWLGLASGAVFAAQTPDNQTAPATVMPWVSDVVKMNDAGISQDVIANYVRNTSAHSTLGADDIIYLRDRGISPVLITAMIQHGAVEQSTPAAAIPMPATPAPAPNYAQYPAYPPASDYQQQPDVNYNYYNYSYPDNGYSTPYWYWNYYYPTYPVWYYPFGFRGRSGFRPGFGGRSFFHGGFNGGFRGNFGGGFHGNFGGGFHGGMGRQGGHR
jgi:hypothetical protein